LTFAEQNKSKVKLNFGLSLDVSIQLKVSLSDSLSERLSQKLKPPIVISFSVYTGLQSTSPLVDCFINHRMFTFSQLNACQRCLLLIVNKVVLMTLLYVFNRMTDKLADINNLSSVGMFSFCDVYCLYSAACSCLYISYILLIIR